MLRGLRVLELGEHGAMTGRLLVAGGDDVTGVHSLRPWRDRFKAYVRDPAIRAFDLLVNGRSLGAHTEEVLAGWLVWS